MHRRFCLGNRLKNPASPAKMEVASCFVHSRNNKTPHGSPAINVNDFEKKTAMLHGALLLALAVACAVSLAAGPAALPAEELWQSGIFRLRLARTLLAVVAGAGLSTAGVLFQAVLRNPLADPYVLGVSSGSGLGAALAIVLGLTAAGAWTLPAAAFLGGLLTIALVYLLARSSSAALPIHALLLSGVVVGTVLGNILMFIVSFAPSERMHNAVWWLLGSLQIFDWELLGVVSAIVVGGIALAAVFARDLNLLALGEEPAMHVGLDVEWTKKMMFVLGSLITGATVAACGLIGFVGLMVPHVVRLAFGPDHRRLLIASAISGAIFLVLADSAARTVLGPRELPIGVVTALLGGPLFLAMLRRNRTPGGR